MGAALFIVLDRDLPTGDTAMDGKALARHADRLAELAQQAGVPDLMSFCSLDENDGLFEDFGIEPEPTVWHPASAGLTTIRVLLSAIAAAGLDPEQAQWVQEDLQVAQTILEQAEQLGIQWHLAVDF
ncbi:hypothetical protein [Synechococcus elongatus]|uniref:hypothetical protein n=1 Tax=Synechococcus elongatus TaxID=32046 RepID=UPI000F7EA2D8|nr:hypothetical protein [Synechococcus elongatus]